MAYTKAPHHKGSHQVRSAKVRAAAYANPSTLCWRCKQTLGQIQQTKPKAKWTAGHLIDGMVDGPLAPECSPCNYGAGARRGNSKRHQPSRTLLTW